jgi:FkbM family methyltransferase
VAKTVEVLSWIGNRIGKPPGWERVVRVFAAPEKFRGMAEVCLVRDGIVIQVQPAAAVGWNVAFFGTYEPELREIFRAVLPIGGIALDIGANVGWHTLLMARLVGENGRVMAAEANPSVRNRLQDNLNFNRFGQVEVLPYAIADSEGTVDFYGPEVDDAESANGYVITDGAEAKNGIIRVETRRIDSIVSAVKIDRLDLVKIDVEGFEWPVLRGGEQTIAKLRPHIIFEYDAESSPRGRGDPRVIAEFFRRHRYRLFEIGRTSAPSVELETWPESANIWALPLG